MLAPGWSVIPTIRLTAVESGSVKLTAGAKTSPLISAGVAFSGQMSRPRRASTTMDCAAIRAAKLKVEQIAIDLPKAQAAASGSPGLPWRQVD